jgi:hypothetical protein
MKGQETERFLGARNSTRILVEENNFVVSLSERRKIMLRRIFLLLARLHGN